MAEPVKAVLFDMDGVVVDSRAVIEAAWGEVFTRYTGRVLTPAAIEEHVHGRVGSYTVAALFPEHPDAHAEIWSAVDELEENAHYQLIPGVRDLLAALTARGTVVGLVTGSWRAKVRNVLSLLDLPTPFATVVTREDVVHGKPHPEPYLLACAALAVDPTDALVFEDSASGVRSALAAGSRCVGIGGADLAAEGAHHVIADFTELRLTGAGLLEGVDPPLSLR
ncbi:HAD family phosphatase [Actinokineospora sp. NBRC 105648]|uniref:HAD family hydrolase n=1 Tax=Actinokineospora sp. NBRC 105648 TaxID=3032206 RepID=UPI0024A52CA0|nr:HAD family phosphatase [Actinokineospora sp. NBRC 105648]GLZ39352.1 hydrolase [Actinokineospora sp. NBRC 105648]